MEGVGDSLSSGIRTLSSVKMIELKSLSSMTWGLAVVSAIFLSYDLRICIHSQIFFYSILMNITFFEVYCKTISYLVVY